MVLPGTEVRFSWHLPGYAGSMGAQSLQPYPCLASDHMDTALLSIPRDWTRHAAASMVPVGSSWPAPHPRHEGGTVAYSQENTGMAPVSTASIASRSGVYSVGVFDSPLPSSPLHQTPVTGYGLSTDQPAAPRDSINHRGWESI